MQVTYLPGPDRTGSPVCAMSPDTRPLKERVEFQELGCSVGWDQQEGERRAVCALMVVSAFLCCMFIHVSLGELFIELPTTSTVLSTL
jgi:hypothetical protein